MLRRLAVLAALIAMSVALPLAILALAILALAILALAILTGAILPRAILPVAVTLLALARFRNVIGLVAGIGHARQALPTRAAGIHRRRQALADVLHVDVGDRQFAAPDARALAVIHRAQYSIIVVRVLQEVFGGDTIPGGAGIARELEVFFQNLIGIAANPRLVPTALVTLPFVLAATHAVRLARTTPTRASILVILLHL
jgi:hypothetical protein